jgi:hypothetical protein
MFLVHPTRLSKIFADSRTHPCGNARHRQASKLVRLRPRKIAHAQPKNESFIKKEPTRKAVFRSGGGPPGVLLPFLTRGSLAFIPRCQTRKQAHTSNAVRPSKSATPSEYQNRYRHASPFCNYFCASLWTVQRQQLTDGTSKAHKNGSDDAATRQAEASRFGFVENKDQIGFASLFGLGFDPQAGLSRDRPKE